jgi:hyperosmotically inducible protein
MFKKQQALPTNAGVAAAVGVASSSGTSQHSKAVAEARQETQIWTVFALNPYLRAGDIKVSVRGGNAILTGIVTEEASKELARQIALGVDGVDTVDNRIEVVSHFVPPPKTGYRAFGEMVEETTVTSAVRSKLAWSRLADGLHANVAASKGRVTLSGTAIDAETRAAAGKLAMNTHGVYGVDNRLEVQADELGIVTSIGAEIADDWITAKVKSTFLYSTYVGGRDISVITKGGIVKLTGKIDDETELALAVELAGNVRGVKSVDSTSLKT